MKKLLTNYKIMAFAALVFVVISCKPEIIEPPKPDNEEELITTVTLKLTDSIDATKTISARFRDVDGAGGQAPTLDSLIIDRNKTYFAEVILLDETKNPAANISDEVAEEANDHQLFFNENMAGLTIGYEDKDSNNPPLPLGLKTKWKTGNSSNGTVQIILKHQPGLKNNTQAPGETDIDITFPVRIK